MSRTIFITGYPGFIAGQLLRRFLAEPGTTGAHARHPGHAPAAEAARDALAENRERTEIVLGDITRPHLGLDESTRDAAGRGDRHRLSPGGHLRSGHAASDLTAGQRRWHGKRARFLRDCCRRCKRFVYFSTAYVSGTRTGRVLEDELHEATSWKNYYELTKWEAEVAVGAPLAAHSHRNYPARRRRRRFAHGRDQQVRRALFCHSRNGRHGEEGADTLQPVLLVGQARYALLHGPRRLHL